jgi:hypothetical protein
MLAWAKVGFGARSVMIVGLHGVGSVHTRANSELAPIAALGASRQINLQNED